MGFSLEEQGTVIQISRNRREVHIWTSDKTMMTKLDNLCEKSEEWTCTGQNRINGEVCGKEYTADKALISFRSNRKKLTDEEKAKLAERLHG